DTRPSTGDLRRVAAEAVALGLPILIIDHFHRMAQPDLQNQTATLAESVRQIKEIATKTSLRIVMAAQAKRAREAEQQFDPPPSDGGLGTSAIEQECDVSVGLYKPRRQGSKKQTSQRMRAYLAGEIDVDQVLMPNTMGVRVLDHRRNGDPAGRRAFLVHQQGKLAPQTAAVIPPHSRRKDADG